MLFAFIIKKHHIKITNRKKIESSRYNNIKNIKNIKKYKCQIIHPIA